MSNSHLVRTQIYLDQDVILSIKQIINSKASKNTKISLASYIRDVLKRDVEQNQHSSVNLGQKRLALSGIIQSSGSGNEAVNHDDIYDTL